jgi:hypothetical protein
MQLTEWEDYIDKLIQTRSICDCLDIDFCEGEKSFNCPPIIKASLLILDKILSEKYKYNFFIFPEKKQTILIFSLLKLIHDTLIDKIEQIYNPNLFSRGEKIKIGNCVVEFIEIQGKEDDVFFVFKMSNMIIYSPINLLPNFQRADPRLPINTYQHYKKELDKIKKLKIIEKDSNKKRIISILLNNKKNIKSPIYFMTPITNTKNFINKCKINNHNIKNIFLCGKTDYKGEIKNIGSGQLAGTPSIVLSSEIDSIVQSLKKGHPAESVIIDASNTNAILSQMDALDELIKFDIPILCISDIANSFELQPFISRNFNVCRWGKNNITNDMYNPSLLDLGNKNKSCVNQNIEYIYVEKLEICESLKLILRHKNEVREQSAEMIGLFAQLNDLIFSVLRKITPFNKVTAEKAQNTLNICIEILRNEKRFIDQETFDDYSSVIKNLSEIFIYNLKLPKIETLEKYLKDKQLMSVCFIVPEKSEKLEIMSYWQGYYNKYQSYQRIIVLYPSEYLLLKCNNFFLTIIVGWLNGTTMRKILFSFNTVRYIILLYTSEKKWRDINIHKWEKALNISNNAYIYKNILKINNYNEEEINQSAKNNKIFSFYNKPNDEIEELEHMIMQNKYKNYIYNSSQSRQDESIEAIPVNFVGGYLAFYTMGHNIVLITNVIINDSNKIDIVLPSKIKIGDFIVLRETGRDLIKDMADILLEKNGKGHLRFIATKWRIELENKKLHVNLDELFVKLVNLGCKRELQTVRSWITDENFIAPQQKEDLIYLIRATGSNLPAEQLEKIYRAAREVRAAHIKAGRIISMQLRRNIVDAINNYGEIDPINISEPIEMELENIGTVRILKVTDVGSPVVVSIADANRLIIDRG